MNTETTGPRASAICGGHPTHSAPNTSSFGPRGVIPLGITPYQAGYGDNSDASDQSPLKRASTFDSAFDPRQPGGNSVDWGAYRRPAPAPNTSNSGLFSRPHQPHPISVHPNSAMHQTHCYTPNCLVKSSIGSRNPVEAFDMFLHAVESFKDRVQSGGSIPDGTTSEIVDTIMESPDCPRVQNTVRFMSNYLREIQRRIEEIADQYSDSEKMVDSLVGPQNDDDGTSEDVQSEPDSLGASSNGESP